MARKILLTHGYSDSNKGDLAIVCGMLKAFRITIPEVEIVMHSVFSADDPNFAFHVRHLTKRNLVVRQGVIPSPYIDDQHKGALRDMKALARLARSFLELSLVLAGWNPHRGSSLRVSQAISDYKSADFIVSKGGQFIYNDQGYVRGILYLWRILAVIGIGLRLRKRVFVLGQSIGPIRYRLGKYLVAKTLRKVERVVVREAKSADLVLSLGIAPAYLTKAPDFAFMIEPDKEIQLCWPKANGYLGVTVVNWYFPDSTNPRASKNAYLGALASTIIDCHATLGLIPVLIAQVTVKHHGESDLELLDELENRLSIANCPLVRLNADFTPEELCAIYGRCTLLLGTRLHSCILATCASTPVIAIRYQGFKTEGIMAELGLDKFVHDIATLDSRQLSLDVAEVVARRNELSAHLESTITRFRAELLDIVRECFQHVD